MNTQMLSRSAALLFLAAAILLLGDDAEAQQRPDPLVAAAAWAPPPVGPTVAQETPPSYERVLLGSTLGAIGGAAVGTGVSLLVYLAREQPDAAMFGPLGELIFIGLPITALGVAVGTDIGARGQASPWAVGAASVVGVGLGVAAGVLVGDALGGAGEYVGGTVGAVIGITVPATVAWATTR